MHYSLWHNLKEVCLFAEYMHFQRKEKNLIFCLKFRIKFEERNYSHMF